MNTEIYTSRLGWAPNQDSDYQPITGRHDEHFLRRLDRLSPAQVDLALALYRDHELVKVLLNGLRIGDTVQRVAISIKDPVRGPFMVVSRDGHFVTCLGDGMRVGNMPVVTQEQFQRVSRSVQRTRDMMAEIAQHPRREVERVLTRLLRCGNDISREEFQAVAAWQPLLAPTFLHAFARSHDQLTRTHREFIGRRNRFKHKDEDALHRYWSDSWAVAHFTLLLGVDGGHYLRCLSEAPEFARIGKVLSWPTTKLNVTSHGIRGTWLAAKVGKPLVSLMKQAYNAPSSDLQMIDAGLALSAIGHAHRKLQSEIGKLLGQTEQLPEGKFGEFIRVMHRDFSAHYQFGIDKPKMGEAYLAHAAQQVMQELAKRYGGPASSERIAAALSPAARDLGVALLLQAPFPIIGEGFRTLSDVLIWLPGFVRLKAEDFYVPRRNLKRSHRTWSVEGSMKLLEPRLQYDRRFGAIVAAAQKGVKSPGRNIPCSCGSQKKYKHCCANREKASDKAAEVTQSNSCVTDHGLQQVA